MEFTTTPPTSGGGSPVRKAGLSEVMIYKYTETEYLCNPWHNFGSDEERTGSITRTWWSNSAKKATTKTGSCSTTHEGNINACCVMRLDVLGKNGKVVMERWS